MDATLVIMAAGLGSRFKGGIKQLEPVGPNGELMMEYAIHDAFEAGFNKVVFIIRHDLEELLKTTLIPKIEGKIKYELVFQDMENIPIKVSMKRTKPWGTGHALLSIKEVVKEPFVIVNADDYYGKEAYKQIYDGLQKGKNCTVVYQLQNTFFSKGTVNRGVCRLEDQHLSKVIETYNISKENNNFFVEENGIRKEIEANTLVSMNIWGFHPSVFSLYTSYFIDFLNNLEETDTTSEFLIPKIVDQMIGNGDIEIMVYKTDDYCMGITYLEDKQIFLENIK